jgi:polyphosphate kinase
MAGVDIDLVIRDICRLRPGLEGLSETVDVYSIVDRFLEHSRIFYFENGARAETSRTVAGDSDSDTAGDGGPPEYYVGSADWMTRNLDNRVEAVTPVDDPAIREQLAFVLDLCLQDNRSAWTMNADGTYDQRRPDDGEPVVCTQDVLMDRTRAAHESGADRGILPAHPAVERTLLVADATERTEAPAESVSFSTNGAGADGSPSDSRSGTASDGESASGSDGPPVAVADSDLPPALVDNPGRWYVPDSDRYGFAVRTPEGGRDYRKTATAAAALVEQYWG